MHNIFPYKIDSFHLKETLQLQTALWKIEKQHSILTLKKVREINVRMYIEMLITRKICSKITNFDFTYSNDRIYFSL